MIIFIILLHSLRRRRYKVTTDIAFIIATILEMKMLES